MLEDLLGVGLYRAVVVENIRVGGYAGGGTVQKFAIGGPFQIDELAKKQIRAVQKGKQTIDPSTSKPWLEDNDTAQAEIQDSTANEQKLSPRELGLIKKMGLITNPRLKKLIKEPIGRQQLMAAGFKDYIYNAEKNPGFSEPEMKDYAQQYRTAERGWAAGYEQVIRERFALHSASTSKTYPVDTINPNKGSNNDYNWGEIKFKNVKEPMHLLVGKLLAQRINENQVDKYFKESTPGLKSIDPAKLGTLEYYSGIRAGQKSHKDQLWQSLMAGGIVERKVGYIDTDVLRDPVNQEVVGPAMQGVKLTDVNAYKTYLSKLAVSSRKEGSLDKLRTIAGMPGSGKSSLMLGGSQGAVSDNAKLRRTTRFPILRPQDIRSASEVIDTTSTVTPEKLDEYLKAADKIYMLSTSTKEEQTELKRRRGSRDTTGVNLFGRKPGSTSGAETDSGALEAMLGSDIDAKKLRTLGISSDYKLKRKENIEVQKKKIALLHGSLSPSTVGHESLRTAAKAMGMPIEDFLVLISNDEGITSSDSHSLRTAVFDQDFRVLAARAAFKGSMVSKQTNRGFVLPDVMEISQGGSGQRRFVRPEAGSLGMMVAGEGKDLKKYTDKNYKPVQIPRTGGVSGTGAREAILGGNLGQMKKILSPDVFSLVSQHLPQLKNRSSILPRIVEHSKKRQTYSLADVTKELASLPQRIDSKKVASDPEYAAMAAQVKDLRNRRDKINSRASFEPFSILRHLAKRYPETYGLQGDALSTAVKESVLAQGMVAAKRNPRNFGGEIQKFAEGTGRMGVTAKRASPMIGSRIPNDPKFGPFAGLAITDIMARQVLRKPDAKMSLEKRKQYEEVAAYIGGGVTGRETAIQAQKERRVSRSTKAGLVGLLPLGWNKTNLPISIPEYGDITIVERGLGKEHENELLNMQADAEGASTRFAARLQEKKDKATGTQSATQLKTLSKEQHQATGTPNMEGAIIEKALAHLGAPLKKNAKSTRPIDYPGGLGAAAYWFPGIDPSWPTEVKRTIDSDSRSEATAELIKHFKLQSGSAAKKMAMGGKASSSQKLGQEIYGLIEKSGLKNETSSIVQWSNSAGYNLQEFKTYLAKRVEQKNSKTGIKTDPKALAESLKEPSFKTSTPAQLALAQKLKGFVDGGVAEEKKTKNYGQIALKDTGSRISASYMPSDNGTTRQGEVTADKRGLLYTVQSSAATQGFGPKLYDIVMEAASSKGSMLTSDRSRVSQAAFNVWKYYYKNRPDVYKTPLDPMNWYQGSDTRMFDPKKFAKADPKTWPPKTDDSWILQTGYRKGPIDINNPKMVQKFANGGAASDTVPAMLTPGEFVINKKAAQSIGYSKLNKMNHADKIQGFASGGAVGGVQRFADGGATGGSFLSSLADFFDRAENLVMEKINSFFSSSNAPPSRPAPASPLAPLPTDPGLGYPTPPRPANNMTVANRASVDRSIAQGTPFGPQTPVKLESTLSALTKALGTATAAQRTRIEKTAPVAAVAAAVSRASSNDSKDIAAAEAALRKLNTEIERVAQVAPTVTFQDILEIDTGPLEVSFEAIDTRFAAMSQIMERLDQSGQRTNEAFNDVNTAYANAARVLYDTGSTAEECAAAVRDVQTSLQGVSEQAIVASSAQQKSNARQQAQSKLAQKIQAGLSYASMAVGIAGQVGANMFDDRTRSGAQAKAATQAGTNTASTGIAMASQVAMIPGAGPALAGIVLVGTAAAAAGNALIAAHNSVIEFDKAMLQTKIGDAMDKVGRDFDNLSKDIHNADILKTLQASLQEASADLSAMMDKQRTQTKAAWGNMLAGDISGGGAQQAKRGEVLDIGGLGSYLGVMMKSSEVNQGSGRSARDEASNAFMSTQITQNKEKSKDQAASFKPVADGILQSFNAQMKGIKGTDQEDIFKQLKRADGTASEFANTIARANPLVNQQILQIENSNSINEADKKSKIDAVIAQEALYQTTLSTNAAMKQLSMDKLENKTRGFVNSFTRSLNNMDRALNVTTFGLDKLSRQSELSSAALSGDAKAGAMKLDSVNVIQNTRGYTKSEGSSAQSQAASFFGSQAKTMNSMLKVSNTMEDTILSSINKTIKKDPKASDEKIGAQLRTSISGALNALELPADLSDKMAKETQNAVTAMRKEGNDTIDFGQLVEQVPALGKALNVAREAQEMAIKALEAWQSNLNEYAEAMNQNVGIQMEMNNRLRKASDIRGQGKMELKKTFGREAIPLDEQVKLSRQSTKTQTGGLTNPADIAMKVGKLENLRQAQQGMSDKAGNRGLGGKDEFKMMQDRLKNTNTALRENYDALKNMAENTDQASLAMARINEIQQKQQAGVGIAERMVTSNPQELSDLNNAMDRLSNNMRGNTNGSTTADQRKQSLDAFNMIAPYLGEKQSGLKANVLESMMKESGQGVNPMMADVINSLRNPEADPEMAAAVQTYKEGNDLQALANTSLAEISQRMADNTADIAADKLSKALTGAKMTFENQIFSDINNNILTLVAQGKEEPGKNALGKAVGGVVYAAMGQKINFTPRGTDTVPAMLTPGEFVVNRSATQQHLPLLKQINSTGLQAGGSVNYLARGGIALGHPYGKKDSEFDFTSNAYQKSENLEKGYESMLQFKKGAGKPMTDDMTRVLMPRFAAASTAGDITSGLFYSPDKPTVPSQDTLLGQSYDSLTIWADNGAVNTSLIGMDAVPTQKHLMQKGPLEKWPTSTSIRGAFELGGDAFAKGDLPKNNKDTYLAKLKEWRAATPKDSDALKEAKSPKTNPNEKITPRLEYDAAADTYVLSNLTLPADDKHSILTKDYSQLLANGKFPQNTLGFFQDYSTGAIASNAVTLGVGTGWSRYGTRIVSSEDQMRHAWSGKQGSTAKKLEGMTIAPLSSLESGVIGAEANLIMNLSAELDAALTQLSGGKGGKQTKESKADIDKKGNLRKLSELYDGTRYSAMFNEDVIHSEIDTPLTIYSPKISNETWAGLMKKSPGAGDGTFSTDATKLMIFSQSGRGQGWDSKLANWTSGDFGDPQIFTGDQEAFEKNDDNKNTLSTDQVYGSPGSRYHFTYKDVKAKLFNDKAHRYFENSKQDFITVQAQSEATEDTNPFSALLPDQIIYAKDIDSLIRTLNLNTPAVGQKAAQSNNPADMYKYNLDTLTKSRMDPYEPDSYVGQDERTPLLNKVAIDAKEYGIAREKAMDTRGLLEAKAEVEKDRIKPAPGPVKDKADRLNSAKRVTLARELHRIAKDPSLGNIRLRSRMPTTIQDITYTAQELGAGMSGGDPNNQIWKKLDAFRAFFVSLQDTNSKTSGNTAGMLINAGLVLNDDKFGDPVKINDPQGIPPGVAKNLYFRKHPFGGLQPQIMSIIKNQMMGTAAAKSVSTMNEEQQNELALTGGKFRKSGFGKDPAAKEEDIPSNFLDLYNRAFDPQSVYPDDTSRADKDMELMMQYWQHSKNADGSLTFAPQLSAAMNAQTRGLQVWYRVQDQAENTGLKNDQQKDKETDADYQARIAGTALGVSYQKNLADLRKPDITKAWDLGWATYQKQHEMLGSNAHFGPLPKAEDMKQRLMVEIGDDTDKKKKEKAAQETRELARGGVVYASSGKLINYEPRGTDTVPAMLTPGEFVVNRASTQQHLPLLKAINNGAHNPQAFSKGGMIYLAEGGLARLEQSLSDLGSWYPEADKIQSVKKATTAQTEKVATQANDAAKKKQKERGYIDKIYGEEKDKQRARIADINSDEYKTKAIEEREARAKAVRARQEIFNEIKRIQDSFVSQFREDLAKIKEETGLGSLQDIFAAFPRLNAENEFIKPKGDITSFLSGGELASFQAGLTNILGAINSDPETFTPVDAIKNMFDIKALGLSEQVKPKQQDPNKARTKQQIQDAIAALKAEGKQFGGMIYASSGKLINYQPRGTDTVPAMLTPGEFVINRASTQKHLPVLNAINSGTYSRGDIVQHLSNGGITISSPNYLAEAGVSPSNTGTGGFDFSGFMKDLTGQIAASFSSVMEEFSKRIQDTKSTSTNGVSNNKSSSSDGISSFLSKLDNIAKVLAGLQIPSDIRITGKHDVNVIINGDKALSALSPSLQALVTGEINRKIEEIAGLNPELKANFNIP